MYFCNTCKQKHEIGEICSTPIHQGENEMAIRDAITTISTTDMSIRERRDKIKNNMRITDEKIYITGIETLEKQLTEEKK